MDEVSAVTVPFANGIRPAPHPRPRPNLGGTDQPLILWAPASGDLVSGCTKTTQSRLTCREDVRCFDREREVFVGAHSERDDGHRA